MKKLSPFQRWVVGSIGDDVERLRLARAILKYESSTEEQRETFKTAA